MSGGYADKAEVHNTGKVNESANGLDTNFLSDVSQVGFSSLSSSIFVFSLAYSLPHVRVLQGLPTPCVDAIKDNVTLWSIRLS